MDNNASTRGNVIFLAMSQGQRAKEQSSRHVCHTEHDGIPCVSFHYATHKLQV